MPDGRQLTKTISTAALRHNWQAIRRRASARHLLAVVKSNAYGHGLATTAQALRDHADGFAVVSPQDAVTLRQLRITAPILLLQGIFSADQTALLTDHRLTPVVHSPWQLAALAQLPAAAQLTAYLKVNTGMNRLGFSPADAPAAMDTLHQTPAVQKVVLMTHFANADRPDGIADALAALAPLRAAGQEVSLGNSAATLLQDDIGDDYARVGIALYGASPAPEWQDRNALGLHPVMTLSTQLIAVQPLQRGAPVGYGGEYTAANDMTIGIASIGYGDGYPRRKGMTATLRGAPVPVVGRVSMEMIALDITALPAAKVGDEVTLWGDAPTVDEVATAAGTIGYELLTAAKGEEIVQ